MSLSRTVIFIYWSHFTAHKHVNNAIASAVGGIFSLVTTGLSALKLVIVIFPVTTFARQRGNISPRSRFRQK